VKLHMSRDSTQDDRQLIRYLLGLLPDEEAERYDEQSVADSDVAARLRTVENDLVDAYVRGTLDEEFRQPFESFYLASPRRRDKVRFAERFVGAVDRAPAAGAAVAAAPRTAAIRSRVVWSLAPAAMLLLACGILFLQDVRLRRGLTEAQRHGADLNGRAGALAGQLDEQRAANDTIRKELDRVRAADPIALVLRAQTRAVGSVSAIALSPGVRVVAFDLELEGSDFPQYQVALKDPVTNHIVWRSDPLTPGSSHRPPAIAVTVPATVLKPQHYLLELSGRNSAGAVDTVGSYAFQVLSR
jgi:hypothetical protein